jgi:hypothetical protein
VYLLLRWLLNKVSRALVVERHATNMQQHHHN